jgi:glycosyltransferase involved in cell wall biosynthesis
MRIALIGARSHPARHGGIERAVESLAEEYVARGHDVTVFVADAQEGPPGGPLVREVGAVRGKYAQALSQAFTSGLRTSHRDFDVAHVHGVGPGIVVPLLKARRVPVVLTVHALDFERDKWPPWAKRLFRRLSRPGVRRADRVICVADHLRASIQDLYGVTSVVVPNGAATPAPEDPAKLLRDLGLTHRDFVLFVGRLVPEKRVEVLLRAHASLGTRVPLVVVGSGEGSYAGDYEAGLRALATEDVRFLGQLPHATVCDLVSAAAVFVNPSSLEGMPLTVLEARLLGTPVVLSDIPPHRELAGSSSALFPLDDAGALADVLADALARRDELLAEAAAERPLVEGTYSWGTVAERTLELYEEAIG